MMIMEACCSGSTTSTRAQCLDISPWHSHNTSKPTRSSDLQRIQPHLLSPSLRPIRLQHLPILDSFLSPLLPSKLMCLHKRIASTLIPTCSLPPKAVWPLTSQLTLQVPVLRGILPGGSIQEAALRRQHSGGEFPA